MRDFKKGFISAIPVITGYMPIGIAFGMMANQAGLTLLQAMGMSIFVYSGASEMAGANMIMQKMAISAIVVTTFILGLRHLILSTCVMDKLRHVSKWKRVLISFWVTDETFAVFMTDPKVRYTAPFFLGLGLGSYFSWNVGTVFGVIAGSFLPEVISKCFSVALYSMFIALLMPGVLKSKKVGIVVVITACLSMIFSQFISSSWTIIIVTLLGAAIGMKIVGEEDL